MASDLADAGFDRLARLASRFLRAPVALVLLIKDEQQLLVGGVGLAETGQSLGEMPLAGSFCGRTVAANGPVLVADARLEPDLALGMGVAYAGVPLRSAEGVLIGTFCVIDTVPRVWSAEDVSTLEDLAALACSEIELRSRAWVVQAEATQERLRQYAERLEHLHEIDQAILAARSTVEIAHSALVHLRRFVSYDRSSVSMVDIANKRIGILALEGERLSGLEAGVTFPLETFGATAEIFQRLREHPVWLEPDINKAATQSRWWDYLVLHGTRTYMHVCLQTQDEVIGLLTLESRMANAFSEQAVENAREVAGPLAVALAQARLWEALAEKERVQGRLLEQVIHAQEDERKRVARELHDDIGQSLTGLTMSLGAALDSLPKSARRAAHILADTQALTVSMMADVRRLIADLRPAVLDDLGLVAALRRLADEVQTRCNVVVTLDSSFFAGRLPTRVESTLFRIVQEALNNVCKHAQARQVEIQLSLQEDRFALVVRDDGRGFAMSSKGEDGPASPADHWGLLGMRERAALLGGTCVIESAEGKGTLVRVELPVGSGDDGVG